MATAEDLLRVARAEVGNTSGKKYWDWYWRGSWSWVNGDVTPYCACFVSWCLSQAGLKAPYFPNAVAFDWADTGGRGVDRYNLDAGELVAFDWDGDSKGDHVGIIEVAHGGGVYTTIEGNTSGGIVARRTRYASQIVCGMIPYFEEDEMTAAEWSKLEKMLGQMEQRIYQNVGTKVWGFRNTSLEAHDAYQILRDIRNALGISDGQKVTKTDANNTGYDRSVIAKIAKALGIK